MNNKAKSGAAIFAAALLDSTKKPLSGLLRRFRHRWSVAIGSNTATGTPASTSYSIVDTSGTFGTTCAFRGVFAGGKLQSKVQSRWGKDGKHLPAVARAR